MIGQKTEGNGKLALNKNILLNPQLLNFSSLDWLLNMKNLTLILSVLISLYGTAVLADQEDESVRELYETVEKSDNDSTLASRIFIQYLSSIRGDTPAEKEFFSKCIKQIRDSGDPDNLATLEDLLNSKQYLSLPNSPSRKLIASLRTLTSEAWYDIKWISADETMMVETALYGVHPSPSVHVDVNVSIQRLFSLKNNGRKHFVQMLLNPDLNYKRSFWIILASSAACSLISPNPFDTPDDHWSLSKTEEDTILQNGGSYGKAVVIQSLLKAGNTRGVKALISWIQQNQENPWIVNSLLQHVKSNDELDFSTQKLFVVALTDFAENAMEALKDYKNELPDTEWAATLYLVNQQLASLRKIKEVQNYFQTYHRFRKDLNINFLDKANQQYRNSVKGSLKYADQYADTEKQ